MKLRNIINPMVARKLRMNGIYFVKPFEETSQNICHDRKIIFIHIQKCAGTSIKKALDISNLTGADHSTATEICHPKTWEEYYTFSVIRNPVHRLISAYRYHTNNIYKGAMYRNFPEIHSLNFNEYLLINSYKTQVDMITHKYSKKPIDFILKFENLSEDMDVLFDKLNIDNNKIPHMNKSVKKRVEIDKEAFKKILNKYESDFAMFDYPKNFDFYK